MFLFIKVFSLISSCVRVDIDGVKSVHNSGHVFMIPSGKRKLKSDLMEFIFTYYKILITHVFLISHVLFDFCYRTNV